MYAKNWDQYYQRTYNSKGKKALWDVPAEEAVQLDLDHLLANFKSDLPLVDLGCGTGAQTVCLSKNYNPIVGLDVSREAIAIARKEHHGHSVDFDVLDATDYKKASQIHSTYGDANIYMRGVLHQILEEDKKAFQNTLLQLMGEKGKIYCIEVADNIRDYFEKSTGNFSELPAKMQQVFLSNLPPLGLSMENIDDFFPPIQFKVLTFGESHLSTNLSFPNGNAIKIPALYVLAEAI